MTNIGEKIGRVVEETGAERQEKLEKSFENIREKGTKVLRVFLSLPEIVSLLGEEAAEKAVEVRDGFFDKIEKAKEKAKDSYEGLKEKTKDSYEGLKEKAINLGLEKVVLPVENRLNKIIETYNGVVDKFYDSKVRSLENKKEKKEDKVFMDQEEAGHVENALINLKKEIEANKEKRAPFSLGRKALLEGSSNEEAA
jgi:hypothetical protein